MSDPGIYRTDAPCSEARLQPACVSVPGCYAAVLHVTVTVWCVPQLLQSATALTSLSPLKHVAPVRKSQMQHALADMLAVILEHNVRTKMPR